MITPAEANPNVNEAAPSPVGFKNVPSVESPVELKLDGQIPSWVNGVMYRSGKFLILSITVIEYSSHTIGSGRYNVLLDNGDTFHIGHPFDGLAMLHRFEINSETQSVKYSSRHTSHGVERRIGQRDPTLLTFGPDPCKTIFGRIQSVYHHISKFGANAALQENDAEFDMVNVTVTPNFPLGDALEQETGVKRGEALVVKRDANTLQVVDPESLSMYSMWQCDMFQTLIIPS